MLEAPFIARLRTATSILIAGAGGGFDIFCGIPLAEALRGAGKTVHLSSLSFSVLDGLPGVRPTPAVLTVNADTPNFRRYFPEQHLSRWYRERGIEQSIHCFDRVGAVALHEGYHALQQELGFDAILMVDGGTDSLMRGDEDGLGTPAEDMANIAAVESLTVPMKMLACLGFGVDRYHGVSNELTLQAIAELTAAGGFLGTCGLTPAHAEVQAYREACAWVFSQMPQDISIVNSSILAALAGGYGDVHASDRTRGSALWVNPIMPIYWGFDLHSIARRVQYLDDMRRTTTWDEVRGVIRDHYDSTAASRRLRKGIPD